MRLRIEVALVRALAPSNLADAIVGDLHETHAALARTVGEAKASAICRGDVARSLFSLVAYGARRTLADDWKIAFACAAVTCALCVATIPLWGHIGMGGAGFHLLRLAVIGLVLGSIPRASTLSCIFLLALIGISDWTIDARESGGGWHVFADKSTYVFVLQDGIAIATMLGILRVFRSLGTLLRARHSAKETTRRS